MKKFGFTLAEVLIVLGIIGVTAALTIPPLMNNVGGAKIGPSLAKFDMSFSQGISNLMNNSDNEWTTLGATGTLAQVATRITDLPTVMKIDRETTMATYTISTATGGTGTTLNNLNGGNNRVFRTADGMIVIIMPSGLSAGTNGRYGNIIADVYVDIDGNRTRNGVASNRAGRDVFRFFLAANGELIPYGSRAEKTLGIGGVGSGGTACSLDNNFTQNVACTGAIAENGWSTTGLPAYN